MRNFPRSAMGVLVSAPGLFTHEIQAMPSCVFLMHRRDNTLNGLQDVRIGILNFCPNLAFNW